MRNFDDLQCFLLHFHSRRSDALCQDNRVEAIGERTARCEQHAHIRLNAGDIDRVDVLEAEKSAEFRFEKRVEGMLFDDLATRSGRELLDRLMLGINRDELKLLRPKSVASAHGARRELDR